MAWIKCPTLMLTTRITDNTVPEFAVDEMANGIPGAKLVACSPIAVICRSWSGRRRAPMRWFSGCGTRLFYRCKLPT